LQLLAKERDDVSDELSEAHTNVQTLQLKLTDNEEELQKAAQSVRKKKRFYFTLLFLDLSPHSRSPN
jgi:hypothetical protein